jgi:hypothetical protein
VPRDDAGPELKPDADGQPDQRAGGGAQQVEHERVGDRSVETLPAELEPEAGPGDQPDQHRAQRHRRSPWLPRHPADSSGPQGQSRGDAAARQRPILNMIVIVVLQSSLGLGRAGRRRSRGSTHQRRRPAR